jgi:nitroreductase
MSIKHATTDHPIHDLLSRRWSPYAFADRDVPADDLRALFEAARWAPSANNEQPWCYLVAVRSDTGAFERLLSCLVEANQLWARHAPVLALGIVRETFARNGESNATALHDLGLAAGNLLTEATARGLAVHQMAGILPDRARDLFAIPDHSRALTALAIGYAGDPASLPERLRERDLAPRTRKPLAGFVFGGRWGETWEPVSSGPR